MAISRTPPLEERIASIRADLDAWIDERVEIEARNCPGVPAGVIRNSITRGQGCQCATVLALKADDAKVAQSTGNAE